MSNSKDWFQRAFDEKMGALAEFLVLAKDHDADIRISACKDGTLIFTASDDEMLRTITYDAESVTYTQHIDLNKEKES